MLERGLLGLRCDPCEDLESRVHLHGVGGDCDGRLAAPAQELRQGDGDSRLADPRGPEEGDDLKR